MNWDLSRAIVVNYSLIYLNMRDPFKQNNATVTHNVSIFLKTLITFFLLNVFDFKIHIELFFV